MPEPTSRPINSPGEAREGGLVQAFEIENPEEREAALRAGLDEIHRSERAAEKQAQLIRLR